MSTKQDVLIEEWKQHHRDRWAKRKAKKKTKRSKNKFEKRKFPPLKEQSYLQLLQHPKWHKRRTEIFRKDKYKCIRCESKKGIQVHHVYYLKDKYPWEYPDEALITLCEECHKVEHFGDIKNRY